MSLLNDIYQTHVPSVIGLDFRLLIDFLKANSFPFCRYVWERNLWIFIVCTCKCGQNRNFVSVVLDVELISVQYFSY